MSIVVCIAGMPFATPTLRVAALLARLENLPVTALTVIEREQDRSRAIAGLEAAVATLESWPADTVLLKGKPVRQILKYERDNPCSLIVMGERDGGRTDLFLSSVVQQVVRQARAPVLVVKQERTSLERILVCTAAQGPVEPVIGLGAHLAGLTGARVTLLHVTNPLPGMYAGLESMEELLSELLQTDTPVAQHLRLGAELLNRQGLTAAVKLRYGVAAHEILREAEEGDYDLIVLGKSPRRGTWRGWLSGNVAREVVDNAQRPVLVLENRTA